MGGLGKTTLAKCVYHDDKIEQHFQEKIWVCVSTPFEVNSILRGILESLKPKNAAVQAIDAMCRILKEKLKEKRYLLVLDDVWNEDAQKWDDLISRLSRVTDTQGATILVTTRSDKAAKIVENLPRFDLRKLSDHECWLILKDKAVGSTPIPEDQENIGREIAKKCGGVPLMAKVLGGWLHSSSDKNDVEMEVRERVSKSKNLRSLFWNGEALGSTLPRALRVLNLFEADIQELPISVGKLKHLRYLNVMKTGVKAIPKSIGQLYHLQTLKMPYHLDEFPKEIANLINLRHVYYGKHVKVPIGILGRLTNLRSLPFLKVGEETAGPGIEELGGLNQLKDTLSIYGLENVRDGEEAQKANLAEKKHVRELVLRWKLSRPSNNVDNEEDVLEGLRPHSNLKFLKIEGFMGVKFPSWLFLSNNLKEIELFECNKCEGVPILGHLPNLVHVKMMRMENLKCLGSEFYGYDHVSHAKAALFPALKN
ncbi:hypothetical protein M0R45_029064 [Rubus argutus]|uniref:Uncharacterized protein n=1 Tax=Rubus argutus TaxID=59490 RepID=A0AAW1W943_RUBAR